MAIVKGKEFLITIQIFKRIYVFTECSRSKLIETKSPCFDLQTALKEIGCLGLVLLRKGLLSHVILFIYEHIT